MLRPGQLILISAYGQLINHRLNLTIDTSDDEDPYIRDFLLVE
jgi:hypothetical protein